MFRWRGVWIAALLALTACPEEDTEAPAPADAEELDAGGDDEPEPAPQAEVVLPVPDAGLMLAMDDAGPLVAADSGSAPILDAAPVPQDASARALDLGAANACSDGKEPLAANIKVSEIAIYQSVKISLFKNNDWVANRNAPVVQGKKSFVRVFVEPQPGFMAHTLRGVLALANGDQTTVLTSERNITRASSDDASDSTFDFSVDGALIGAETRFTVALLETSCVRTGASTARVPASGNQLLSADAIGKLRLVIVPVSYQGRTPDTGALQLERLRSELSAYYPSDVEVSVRAPLDWSQALASTGTGWTDLLMQIQRARQEDGAANNVYYFGWVLPSATFKDYCRFGCVLGLAPQTTTISRSNQIGVGVGFIDENTYSTVVHELGHAQGLPHAPCAPKGAQIEGVDTKFPYEGGKIGVWGWDARSAKLLAPGDYRDVMSYCEPTWISDHNYKKLAERAKAVNGTTTVYTLNNNKSRVSWRGLVLYRDGSARWSGVTSREQPGELSSARALDAEGSELEQVDVVRVPLSNDEESFLYVPELDPSWTAIDLGDRALTLAEIAQPF